MATWELHVPLIDSYATQGHVTRSLLSPKIKYENEYPQISHITSPDEQFFSGSGAVYNSTEDYYEITLDSVALVGSVRLFSNAVEEGDGMREMIKKTAKSESAGVWQFQEIENSEGQVEKIATKAGKSFDFNATYRITYLETE